MPLDRVVAGLFGHACLCQRGTSCPRPGGWTLPEARAAWAKRRCVVAKRGFTLVAVATTLHAQAAIRWRVDDTAALTALRDSVAASGDTALEHGLQEYVSALVARDPVTDDEGSGDEFEAAGNAKALTLPRSSGRLRRCVR